MVYDLKHCQVSQEEKLWKDEQEQKQFLRRWGEDASLSAVQ